MQPLALDVAESLTWTRADSHMYVGTRENPMLILQIEVCLQLSKLCLTLFYSESLPQLAA